MLRVPEFRTPFDAYCRKVMSPGMRKAQSKLPEGSGEYCDDGAAVRPNKPYVGIVRR